MNLKSHSTAVVWLLCLLFWTKGYAQCFQSWMASSCSLRGCKNAHTSVNVGKMTKIFEWNISGKTASHDELRFSQSLLMSSLRNNLWKWKIESDLIEKICLTFVKRLWNLSISRLDPIIFSRIISTQFCEEVLQTKKVKIKKRKYLKRVKVRVNLNSKLFHVATSHVTSS